MKKLFTLMLAFLLLCTTSIYGKSKIVIASKTYKHAPSIRVGENIVKLKTNQHRYVKFKVPKTGIYEFKFYDLRGPKNIPCIGSISMRKGSSFIKMKSRYDDYTISLQSSSWDDYQAGSYNQFIQEVKLKKGNVVYLWIFNTAENGKVNCDIERV